SRKSGDARGYDRVLAVALWAPKQTCALAGRPGGGGRTHKPDGSHKVGCTTYVIGPSRLTHLRINVCHLTNSLSSPTGDISVPPDSLLERPRVHAGPDRDDR